MLDRSLFADVADALRGLVPKDLGVLRCAHHRYGIKVWVGPSKPPREHYEAQVISFQGPLETFSTADAYIGALRGLSQIVKAAEEQKVFVDGNDVCVIYDLVTATPAGTAPTVEWYHLRNGKISSVRVFFDARPFAPMFEHNA